MEDKDLKALAIELSKSLKTPKDLNQLCAMLKKVSIEAEPWEQNSVNT